MRALARPLESDARTGTRLGVDLDAIAANTRRFAGATDASLMAVVKADGFGHGAVDVARTALANGATWLGVTSVTEALELRTAGLRAPVLSWLNPVDADFWTAIAAGVDLAVPTFAHLEAVSTAARTLGGRARVHLHLDTGLARDGAPPAQWASLCRAARRAERQGSLQVVGMMGHLACADTPTDPSNGTGRTRFAWGLELARAAGLRPQHRHLAATAAALTDPRSHHTMVRIGAGLVGIDPSHTTSLRPAVELTTPIISVRQVRGGTPVGYGHTRSTREATTLALIGLGYADGLPRVGSDRAEVADGLPRVGSDRAEVQVAGRRCRVIGRISMDQTVIDLGPDTGLAPAEEGDLVTVFGPGGAGEPTVADWAAWCDTIEHEIVTGIGARVRRTPLRLPLRGLR
ncbi:Alanine racemase [metagenome]|uniref:Alanine racemase n=1 Tax=metagenome TaxID=256318 RepID=A0A2P2C4Y6_9ZZZZ